MSYCFFSYFHTLFTPNVCINYNPFILTVNTKINEYDNMMLLAPFTIDEFKDTTFSMHSDKSLSPDGLNMAFYHHFWDLLGGDVFKVCMS